MKRKNGNLIRSKERVKTIGEVFTPPEIVEFMLDIVNEYIIDIRKTILEPSCGHGNFLVAILKRRLSICQSDKDRLVALSTIYGIDIMEDNIQEAKSRILEILKQHIQSEHALRIAEDIINKNIVHGDFLTMKQANGEDIIIYSYEFSDNLEDIKLNATKLCNMRTNQELSLF